MHRLWSRFCFLLRRSPFFWRSRWGETSGNFCRDSLDRLLQMTYLGQMLSKEKTMMIRHMAIQCCFSLLLARMNPTDGESS